MKTAVMTDSNSGIKPEEAEKLGIYSLSMPVIIDGNVYYEEKTISQDRFYGDMISGKDITSTQPSPGDVIDMWEELFREGYEQIVYIPMSSGLSASCHAAAALAEEYDEKIQVVDDHRISVTMRQSVLDAKYMADKGMTAAEIKKKLEENAYNSSIYIAVDTLEYLKKGGRVTAAGAAIGTVLNIKPVLTIQGEKLDAFAKVRGMKKAEIKMLDSIEEDLNTRFGNSDRDKIRIGAAGTFLKEEDARQWHNMVKERFGQIQDVYYDPLSFSIGCHVGPNAIGIGISIIMRDKQNMKDKQTRHYSFFQNKECEFFPCHQVVDESQFNCLFCYCPLYSKGCRCGGHFTYTEDGIKDCSNCTFPHEKDNYDRMIKNISDGR